jgi:excinuclease UvrABC nuclease subunit
MENNKEILVKITSEAHAVSVIKDIVNKYPIMPEVLNESPGIYLFIECDFNKMTKRIAYTGMSMNLRVRLQERIHHAYHKWLRRNRNNNTYLLRYFMVTDDCAAKEIRYIKKFKPQLNVRL